ncbi:MAG: flagellar hook assembly protein FlgD [Bdellovibrionaceae bacterium]|nr:flagellar hook assembly protein FlgD [Pseudobdellovibrionaceae bacterium]
MKVNTNTSPATEIAGSKSKMPQESVGDIANRVANSGKPTGRRVQGKGNAQLDKDAFFKLMLAQVKNQDPTNPMKNHEMAAQLAQFSSLEQMSNVNETLKSMHHEQGQDSQFQALNLMGKVVRGDSSKLNRLQNDAAHDLSFTLKDNASEVNIAVANTEGKIVKRFTLSNLNQGPNHVQWDGKDDAGVVQPQGTYRIGVEAKDAAGARVATQSEFGGRVTGVQFSETGPIVSIGKQSIPLKDIKIIEEENNKNDSDMAVASLRRMVPQSSAVEAMKSPIPQGLPMQAAELAQLNLNSKLK